MGCKGSRVRIPPRRPSQPRGWRERSAHPFSIGEANPGAVIDSRADLFSVDAVLYQLIGRRSRPSGVCALATKPACARKAASAIDATATGSSSDVLGVHVEAAPPPVIEVAHQGFVHGPKSDLLPGNL